MNRRLRSPAALPALVFRTLRTRVRQVSFWLSVLLPMTYVPVLYGIDGKTQPLLLAVLVGVNVVALVAGHDYSR